MEDYDRKSGRTTRIIDAAIQTLFTKGEVFVQDHHPSVLSHKYCFDRVVDRLRFEFFGGLKLSDYIEVDRRNFIIKLKKDKYGV